MLCFWHPSDLSFFLSSDCETYFMWNWWRRYSVELMARGVNKGQGGWVINLYNKPLWIFWASVQINKILTLTLPDDSWHFFDTLLTAVINLAMLLTDLAMSRFYYIHINRMIEVGPRQIRNLQKHIISGFHQTWIAIASADVIVLTHGRQQEIKYYREYGWFENICGQNYLATIARDH